MNCRIVEGVTFHKPQLSAVLRERVVESRLHMDYPARIPAEKFPVHARLQQELIGTPAVPYYAILDPETDEFLFKLYFKAGDRDLLLANVLRAFERLPDKRAD